MSEIRSQATPARDKSDLADIIHIHVCANNLEDCIGECRVAASDVIADGWLKPRTVNSATELDALPVNSVVVDASDTPRTKRYGDSHMGAGWTNAGRSPLSSRELADGRPMRVLFTPGDAG